MIANVYPKLQNVKTGVDHAIKNALSEHSLAVNMLKGPKRLRNLYERSFIILFWSLWGEMIWKMSSLLKFEILGVFLKTLTASDKYAVPDS